MKSELPFIMKILIEPDEDDIQSHPIESMCLVGYDTKFIIDDKQFHAIGSTVNLHYDLNRIKQVEIKLR
jgi:hypothetical protein